MAPEAKLRKSSKPSATTEAGLPSPGICALGDARCRRPERAAGERVAVRLAGFSISYSIPASARHLSSTRRIAEAVGPAHAGRGEFLPAGEDRLGGGVGLEGIEVPRLVDADGLARAVGTRRCRSCPGRRRGCRRRTRSPALRCGRWCRWMRSTLSSLAHRPRSDTWAMMPFSNCSTADAHSSVPLGSRWATPETLTGSRKGLPAAAPAMKRAIETG